METAHLSFLSDIYSAVDKSEVSLLALFDVSAAFNKVDISYQILIVRLETSFGLIHLFTLDKIVLFSVVWSYFVLCIVYPWAHSPLVRVQ